MKKLKVNVTYHVPSWNFCNSDNLINGGELTKNTCRFCVKSKEGHKCLLYDEHLSVKGRLISKVRKCCIATAANAGEVVPAPEPTIQPKELMEQTIKIYTQYVDDLIKQGYPRQMAERAAKKFILT